MDDLGFKRNKLKLNGDNLSTNLPHIYDTFTIQTIHKNTIYIFCIYVNRDREKKNFTFTRAFRNYFVLPQSSAIERVKTIYHRIELFLVY